MSLADAKPVCSALKIGLLVFRYEFDVMLEFFTINYMRTASWMVLQTNGKYVRPHFGLSSKLKCIPEIADSPICNRKLRHNNSLSATMTVCLLCPRSRPSQNALMR